jgi:SPP1 gp7 family putative phage head morphogenesis protein
MTFSSEFKEAEWKAQVQQAEKFEPKAIHALKEMFAEQEQEVLQNLEKAVNRDAILLNERKARESYITAMTPHLTEVMKAAVKNGMDLVRPKNPHKADPLPPGLSQAAIDWLKTRMAWAAAQVGEETEQLLRAQLLAGYENGESIPQISDRIQQLFDGMADYRAERIARTEIMSASAQGTIEGYKSSGVVSKAEFYPAVDERECESCASIAETDMYGLGQGIFPIDECEGIITVHPGCRCIWLAIID